MGAACQPEEQSWGKSLEQLQGHRVEKGRKGRASSGGEGAVGTAGPGRPRAGAGLLLCVQGEPLGALAGDRFGPT